MSFNHGTRHAHGFLRHLAVASVAAVLAIAARASVPAVDLGDRMRYIRLADASELASFQGAEVIDLRFTDALPESAENLAGRLRAAAESDATLFVLVNAATDPLLRHALSRVQGKARSLIFIGPVTPELAPEIVTDPDPGQERRACDAIAAGTPPADLIVAHLDKPRFDEAELFRTHANGGANPHAGAGEIAKADDAPEADGESKPDSAPKPDAAPKSEPLLDVSLQRAVFLHKALIALGRLGGAA